MGQRHCRHRNAGIIVASGDGNWVWNNTIGLDKAQAHALAASRRASFSTWTPSAHQEFHRCKILFRAIWCVTSQLTEWRYTTASAIVFITTGSAERAPACF